MAAASKDGQVPHDKSGTNPDRGEDLNEARRALQRVPEMSEARMSEIKDRIKRGYYSRSDVLDRIAKRLTRHLVD